MDIHEQDRSVIFPTLGVELRNKFYLKSSTNIYEILTKNSAPNGKIRSERLSDALKISSKQINLNKGMHL